MPDIFKVTLKIDTLSTNEIVNCKTALKELNQVNQACKTVPIVIDALKSALENEDDIKIKETLLQPLIMLDGKIQKLIMLLDSHIDNERTLRIQSGIDAKLDSIQNDLDECMENFTEEQGKGVKLLSKNIFSNFILHF